MVTEDQRNTRTSESKQKLGLSSGQGPAREDLAGRWLRRHQAGEDTEADGGDTLWPRSQQLTQDSLAHTDTALTDAIQDPGQLPGGRL